MGEPDNPNAVLDPKLCVRGVSNLRVAYVSSVPKVNNGHTQMVAYGIGEGAAEMIRQDAKNSLTPKMHSASLKEMRRCRALRARLGASKIQLSPFCGGPGGPSPPITAFSFELLCSPRQ
jgi:hypothetical protein